jgi:hypothetical protein
MLGSCHIGGRFAALYKTSPNGGNPTFFLVRVHSVSAGSEWDWNCNERRRREEGLMLKVERSANGQVIFTLIGRMVQEDIGELERLFQSESNVRNRILDLRDLTLVDRDAVRFLGQCEEDNIRLKNCPAYIREWITRERRGN